MKHKSIILVRHYNGIYIDSKARGYLIDGTPVKRKFYGGRLCYTYKSKIVGYKSLCKSKPIHIEVNQNLPF